MATPPGQKGLATWQQDRPMQPRPGLEPGRSCCHLVPVDSVTSTMPSGLALGLRPEPSPSPLPTLPAPRVCNTEAWPLVTAGRVGAFKCSLAHRRGRERSRDEEKTGSGDGENGGVETVAPTCIPHWHTLGSLTSVTGAEGGHGEHRSVPGIVG